MATIDRFTGRVITDRVEKITQRVGLILATPVGTVWMLRDFGSKSNDLQDAPANPLVVAELTSSAAMALERWEREVYLRQLVVSAAGVDGETELSLDLRDRVTNEALPIKVVAPLTGTQR